MSTHSTDGLAIREGVDQLKLQRIGLFAGCIGLGLYAGALVLANLVIPTPPDWSAAQITDRIVDENFRIRLGCALGTLAAVLMLPFFAAIAQRIARIERKFGMLSLTAAMTMLLNVVGLIYPLVVLVAATYRAGHRSDEINQAFDDLFWLMFLSVIGPVALESILLAIATFLDPKPVPTFPRWFGYFNLWTAATAIPGCLLLLVPDGPMSWNGVLGYWIPATDFTVWTYVTAVVLLRSIQADRASGISRHHVPN
ncbi:hypothetical protein ACNO8X_16470 [Mycobacterium sp. PDNC021]|uniref:hypothetical protein n=1 Tax=Mycobacterium sp. PDNC021 TaxID=3391399 RepID=UPI003AAFBD14